MTSQQAQPADSAPHAGHETSDVKISGLLWLAGTLIVSAVVIHLLLWVLLRYFQATALQADPQISPLAADRPEPPTPRLQQAPIRDYQQFRAAQEKSLNSYGWIDKQQGVVHLPVSRAMDLLLERGLPEPEGSASAQESASENSDGEGNNKTEKNSDASQQGAAP